jgi:hypothetical protein
MAITLSLIPDPSDPNTKLYVGQKLQITVVGTATGGTTIADGANATITNLGSGFQFRYQRFLN